jgi:hypothetical protein
LEECLCALGGCDAYFDAIALLAAVSAGPPGRRGCLDFLHGKHGPYAWGTAYCRSRAAVAIMLIVCSTGRALAISRWNAISYSATCCWSSNRIWLMTVSR